MEYPETKPQYESVQQALRALPPKLLETVYQSGITLRTVEDVERFRQNMTQG